MKKPNISPKEYSNILRNLELNDIALIEGKAKIDKSYQSQKLNLIVNDRNKYEISGKKFIVTSKYTFKAKGKDLQKAFVEISAYYELIFSLNESIEITMDFFEIFEEMSLGIIVWPYFREYVQSQVTRMNLPPLTLPMRKRLID